MKDQADTLRKLMRDRLGCTPEEQDGATVAQVPVVAVTSANPASPRSTVVLGMASAMARAGLQVMVATADIGADASEADIEALERIVSGDAPAESAFTSLQPGLRLAPSASVLKEAFGRDPGGRAIVAQALGKSAVEVDLILLDCRGTSPRELQRLHRPSHQTVLVVTPEPSSLTDTYGLIKSLRRDSGVLSPGIIVAGVGAGSRGAEEARYVFKKLEQVTSQFLDVSLSYLGHYEGDEKIVGRVPNPKFLLELNKGGSSLASIELVSKRVRERSGLRPGLGPELGPELGQTTVMRTPSKTVGFWTNLLGGYCADESSIV